MSKVRMWLQTKGQKKIEEDVEVPDHCFDENGVLLEGDVIEYVEEWVQECASWGALPMLAVKCVREYIESSPKK